MAEGRRISIDKNMRNLIDELRSVEGPLNNIELSELFAIAIIFGKKYDNNKGKRTPLGEGKRPLVLEQTLSKTNIEYLMMAVAIEEKNNFDILKNKDEYYTISEEYAKTGMKVIYEEYFNPKKSKKQFLEDLELEALLFYEKNIES